jgi:heat shock protein HslJ
MRSLPLVGLTVAAIVALAACTGGAASPSAPASDAPRPIAGVPATVEQLDGKTYLAQSATGYTIVEGSTITLRFEGNRLGASAGCNQMSGEYEIVDGLIKVGPMITTEMACDEPLMAQDQWLAGFLDGAAADLDGDTLLLANGDATLTLLDEQVAVPDQSLEGPTWTVTSVTTGGGVSSYAATATLVFADGTVEVNAGCNTGSGSYELGEGTVTFGPVATTKKLCDDAANQLEQGVLAVLDGEATYAIDGDTLTLSNGGTSLTLTAG